MDATRMRLVPDGCRLIGDVDGADVGLLLDALTECIDRTEHALIVVDCSRLGYVGAAGVRALLDAHHYAKAQGRRLVLFDVPPPLRKIVDVGGIAYVSADDDA
jgi:anti-anti-sigma factor